MYRPYRIPITQLLFITLGLTACNPTLPKQPQYQSAGLFEVRYTVQGDQVTSEFIPIGSQAFVPQRFQELPKMPAFTNMGSTGIKDLTTNFTHLTGLFKFTNTYGRPLKNVIVVPANTDDTDGDATNNATTPTIGSTPYAKVIYFNGTDASALAATISPQQGKTINLKTGDVINDPLATPFSTVDLTGVTFIPPVGLSANLYGNQAWIIGDISEGSTAYLTLSNRYPTAINPTQEIYTFSIVMGVFEEVN